MVARSQIPARWSLFTEAQDGRLAALEASIVVAPPIPNSSLTPLLSALLPNRDHNDDLMQQLALLRENTARAQPIFSVFAADPFIKVKRLAQRLRAKGYERVINWPTTAQYGPEFCRALDG